MSTADDYYDTNTDRDFLWKVRREKNRTSTDLAHLFSFCMFVILWIGIAIHAFTAAVPPLDILQKLKIDERLDAISEALYEGRNACFGFIWLAVWLLALYFIMIRWLTKHMIYTTVILMPGVILFGFYLIMHHITPSLFIPILVAIFSFYLTILYILKKEGTRELCQIIKDSCSAMICFPASIIIVIAKFTLYVLVIAISAAVIFCLMMIPNSVSENCADVKPDSYSICRRSPPTYIYVLSGIHAFITVLIVSFIYSFGRMILHGNYATWYRTSDKSIISYTITLHHLAITLRYHMGTLAYGSGFLTIFKAIRTVYNFSRNRLKEIVKSPMMIFSLWIIMSYASVNTLIVCIVCGTGYAQSSTHAFESLMQNPLAFAAVRSITRWMLFLGIILIPILTLSMAYAYFINQLDAYTEMTLKASIITITCVSFLITAILLDIFNTAIEAVLYCSLEESASNRMSVASDELAIEEPNSALNI